MRKRRLVKVLVAALTVISLSSVFPKVASAEWRQDGKGWWYSDGNTYYTGWKLIDSNWYYFYSDGYMATNDKIDDYFVNSTGVWTNAITADEAYELILNEDGNFISKIVGNGCSYPNYIGERATNTLSEVMFPIDEICYEFEVEDEYDTAAYEYWVGEKSKNVYCFSAGGIGRQYEIQDNEKVGIVDSIYYRNNIDWR